MLLEQARHVSLVVGPDGYRALPQLLDGARQGERVTATSFDLEEHYEDFSPRRFDLVKAWIPVQRGCDYRCTYCIVPYTRGSERSRQLADVVREAEQVVRDGMGEVVLLGQTVNSYHDGSLRLRGPAARGRRGRGHPPHPLHEPASERLLRARGRRAWRRSRRCASTCTCRCRAGPTRCSSACCAATRREGYRECVARLRAAIPTLNLTTDIIVGFPGETEADFEETLALVREIGFEDAYTFKFSPRDGTPATRMDPSTFVPDDVASARLSRLIDTVRAGARERNLTLLGTRTRC